MKRTPFAMAGILMVGFLLTSCSDSPNRWARKRIVVVDAQQHGIPGLQVEIKYTGERYYGDSSDKTLSTDASGNAECVVADDLGQLYSVVVKDIDGASNGGEFQEQDANFTTDTDETLNLTMVPVAPVVIEADAKEPGKKEQP